VKVLTAAEMREVDRLTIEGGIPGLILMENAGSRLVDVLISQFAPLREQRVLVACGKGNNGGDGFVVARQLFTRRLSQNVLVVHLFEPAELTGDALINWQALVACGCPVQYGFSEQAFTATLVIDAVLGTGLKGPATGPSLDAIRSINTHFPFAQKVAVDIPSGLSSDETTEHGDFVKVDATVTFTAPKLSQCLSPSYEWMGALHVVPIGSPDGLCESNPALTTRLTTPADIAHLFAPRSKNSNKGMYGHVLVIGGSSTKPGAAAMAGISAYRAGAGLVTVASAAGAISAINAFAPELMTEPLPETNSGHISLHSLERIHKLLEKKTVVALGPGLGTDPETVQLVQQLYSETALPMVVDADALNALAGKMPQAEYPRFLTPHPGEMSRLSALTVEQVQQKRLGVASTFSQANKAIVILKGDRTLIAFPSSAESAHGQLWINPTGSPSMATGGTGDILTGMIAGLLAQHPNDQNHATVAAVWLHGRCGELGARDLGEQAMLATDLLHFLPEAMRELRSAL
jgi:ADP-dependent NAD(P)H-hydrate dehydratase / NAD(P)H-hydrate epimerase